MTQQNNIFNVIKQLENASSVMTTEEYIGSRKIECHSSFKIFKPSIFFRVFILCFFGWPLIYIVYHAFQAKTLTHSELGGMLAGGLGSAIFMVNAINQFFVSKDLNYKIRVDTTGISFDDKVYKWQDIYATAIMTKFGGNRSYKYLVIASDDRSTYQCYDLINFISLNTAGFSMRLSQYIGYFKPQMNTFRPA
jgi:hypothetical protein